MLLLPHPSEAPKRGMLSLVLSCVTLNFSLSYSLMTVLGLCCRARAFCSCREPSWCTGFSLCALGGRVPRLPWWLQRGLVVVASGLWSTGSVVVVHRLSCPIACQIFLDQVLNLCPLNWHLVSLNHQGSPELLF